MYQENGGLHGGDAFSMDDQNDITAAIAAAEAAEMDLQLYHEIEQYYFSTANMHFHHHHPQQHMPAEENFNQMLLHNPPEFLGYSSHYGGAAAYDPSTPLNQPPLLRESKRKSNTTASEKQRRVIFGNKYETLKSLLPSPTKNDRASILGDAISYINELKRTETELKILLQNKKNAIERNKRPKKEEEDECVGDMNPCNGSSLRSSWLHRKSKRVEVDVKIIDDEITVKLVHQKRINCLLFVSEALDELGLDLLHVSGGVIGDFSSYLLNSKICEGSIVYASAVAKKVIEVVDKQFDAVTINN